ncbi:Ras-like protein [Acrasis kona]|uniref:Ras-like protein n=1 Tax=Acrasis kona TaxID=1008807 RepID=A0AAW2ZD71_9EUKA
MRHSAGMYIEEPDLAVEGGFRSVRRIRGVLIDLVILPDHFFMKVPASLLMLSYAVDKKSSLDFLTNFVSTQVVDNTSKVVVGLRLDLNREVSYDDATLLAEQICSPLVEVSSKTGRNFDRAIDMLHATSISNSVDQEWLKDVAKGRFSFKRRCVLM